MATGTQQEYLPIWILCAQQELELTALLDGTLLITGTGTGMELTDQ
jgi:hypothetical protein